MKTSRKIAETTLLLGGVVVVAVLAIAAPSWARRGHAGGDTMTQQLNAQELARLQSGEAGEAAPPMAGTMPGMSCPPGMYLAPAGYRAKGEWAPAHCLAR